MDDSSARVGGTRMSPGCRGRGRFLAFGTASDSGVRAWAVPSARLGWRTGQDREDRGNRFQDGFLIEIAEALPEDQVFSRLLIIGPGRAGIAASGADGSSHRIGPRFLPVERDGPVQLADRLVALTLMGEH